MLGRVKGYRWFLCPSKAWAFSLQPVTISVKVRFTAYPRHYHGIPSQSDSSAIRSRSQRPFLRRSTVMFLCAIWMGRCHCDGEWMSKRSLSLITAYNLWTGRPISTFGECPIIFVENLIIIFLISMYDADKSLVRGLFLISALGSLFAASCTEVFPMVILATAFKCNLIMVLGSRLPQIYEIFKDKSTGNNAFITWFLNFAGSAARLFTTFKVKIWFLTTSRTTCSTSHSTYFALVAQEVDDLMARIVISTSTTCNGIIFLQFLLYWNSDSKKKKDWETRCLDPVDIFVATFDSPLRSSPLSYDLAP